MLKDWILRCSSQRYVCKVVAVVGGVVVLALTAGGKLTAFTPVLWVASPLLLFWWMDAGLAAERRCGVDLLKKDPTKDDTSVLLLGGSCQHRSVLP